MKKIFLLGLLILSVQAINAQSCRDILNKAQASYQAGDLRLAMRQLQDAEICDYKNELQKERQRLQQQIFDAVDKAKVEAEAMLGEVKSEQEKTNQALAHLEEAKRTSDSLYQKVYESDSLNKLTLANLEKANASKVELLLAAADRDVYNLNYEEALEKIKAAASLGALNEETARHYLEIAFWYGEAGNLELAKNILQSAAILVNKTAIVKQPFRESIKAFAPDVYHKLMERYYPVMVNVMGGTFDIGCESEKKFGDLHKENFSSFQIAKYETTWWQYYLFCKATGLKAESPGWGTDGNNPAVNVSWFDALKYCNWVSRQFGEEPAYDTINYTLNLCAGYRLPTEAEWEYAAKGGNLLDGTIYSGGNEIDSVAWHSDNSRGRTQPTGEKNANNMGLFDMSGNVWEWCWDTYSNERKRLSGESPANINRVLRGGSWFTFQERCQVSYRLEFNPVQRNHSVGFRLLIIK